MSQEEKIKSELEERFAYLKGSVLVRRQRRVFFDLPREHFSEVFDHLVKNMQFSNLSAITGMDEGDTFGVIYHLNREEGVIVNLRIHIPRLNPVIKSVTEYFPAAEMYERELEDLLGIEVSGLAEGRRYPLPDNWPHDQFPLRKEWKGEQNA